MDYSVKLRTNRYIVFPIREPILIIIITIQQRRKFRSRTFDFSFNPHDPSFAGIQNNKKKKSLSGVSRLPGTSPAVKVNVRTLISPSLLQPTAWTHVCTRSRGASCPSCVPANFYLHSTCYTSLCIYIPYTTKEQRFWYGNLRSWNEASQFRRDASTIFFKFREKKIRRKKRSLKKIPSKITQSKQEESNDNYNKEKRKA